MCYFIMTIWICYVSLTHSQNNPKYVGWCWIFFFLLQIKYIIGLKSQAEQKTQRCNNVGGRIQTHIYKRAHHHMCYQPHHAVLMMFLTSTKTHLQHHPCLLQGPVEKSKIRFGVASIHTHMLEIYNVTAITCFKFLLCSMEKTVAWLKEKNPVYF